MLPFLLVVLLSGVQPTPAPQPPKEQNADEAREALKNKAMTALQLRLEASKPKVWCGMKVIVPDLNIDPKIAKAVPDQDVKHTIRVIPPPVCHPQ